MPRHRINQEKALLSLGEYRRRHCGFFWITARLSLLHGLHMMRAWSACRLLSDFKERRKLCFPWNPVESRCRVGDDWKISIRAWIVKQENEKTFKKVISGWFQRRKKLGNWLLWQGKALCGMANH